MALQISTETISSNFSKILNNLGIENVPAFISGKFFDTYFFLIFVLFILITNINFSKFLKQLFGKLKRNTYSRKTSNKDRTSKIIKSLIYDLEYSIPLYENFYAKYKLNGPSVNMAPLIDKTLEILTLPTYCDKNSALLDIEILFSYPDAHKIKHYYNDSKNLILWLKLAKKVMITPLEDNRFLEYYRELAIFNRKQQSGATDLITVDPVVEYRKYMEYFYIPKIKKLKKTAEELIQILRSKHTS